MSEKEWRDYLLTKISNLEVNQTTILVEIGKLKIKSGVWGLIGGAVPVIIGLGIWIVRSI